MQEECAQFFSLMSRQLCNLFVRLREQHMLPDTVARSIFNSFSSVLDGYHTSLTGLYPRYLSGNHIDLHSDTPFYRLLHKEDVATLLVSDVSSE